MAAPSTPACRSAATFACIVFPPPAAPAAVIEERGRVDAWSVAPSGAIAYTYASPSDLAQLYLRSANGQTRQLTNLNADVLRGVAIAEVEAFSFISNDNRFEVEAFLTQPIGRTADSRHPCCGNARR